LCACRPETAKKKAFWNCGTLELTVTALRFSEMRWSSKVPEFHFGFGAKKSNILSGRRSFYLLGLPILAAKRMVPVIV
jgi:hypothetical protein